MCGAVRIRASGSPLGVPYCHCGDCRKSTGAPVALFAGYAAGQVEVERGAPQVYESSPGVRRSFCGGCGTSLFYEDERLPGEIYVHVGVFDDPARFEPTAHSWYARRLGWMEMADDLPRHARSSRPR
jgi:hypothetical protein